jgi:hypothetical protein
MTEFDRDRIEQIVTAIANGLDGDWLLLGGALVALWLEPRRITEDVDIIGLAGAADERYRLLELADSLGLPIEAVNSAADFFVRRITGWRTELEVFRRGARATIYRPTATLFLLLKLNRLSARDLDDCRSLIDCVRHQGLPLDRARVLTALDSLAASDDEALRLRRSELRRALTT